MAKVVISCAVTGSAHTPTMSAALPITPEEIASQAIEAAEAGAAILHLHARVPEDGRPTGDPDVYQRFLPTIKQATDAVVNITTGGAATMSVQERLAAAAKFQPEMCSLNMGSLNFAFFPAAKRISEWKFPWEKDYVVNSDDYIFRNTFRDIAYILETMSDAGTRFEHECYDVGHLYNLAHFLDRGLIRPGFFVQMIFGILGGIGPDLENLMFMKQSADRLFGRDTFQWSVLAAGRHQMPFLTQAALMGGHVRVGLEDSLFIERGKLAVSNAEQVRKIARILREMGHEPASPAEAREILALKGGDRVAY
ncbi:3-keto-5-aminohexanoate cleavage protein [Rhizorhabdus dicambivorans]|uniref:3-keto-5-aminohexanoate cleavage protein n=1 Tax=Rhizorhabdus dicambivorans TaxID=1850238 RepID=A0A2A4FT35_9SPHN|nr:3-keto-5-aminohexanoate cleavage protein [Rhizorhabdus dicambivorans]ATE64748.1 3-keto-5-aminohexanoate cleavage protein [Rhizorhabdus dicambivorans]PCE41309.1 3-keto-5-aminohexanoate cleavage protein [Rhizorhabdus dicambivorans]